MLPNSIERTAPIVGYDPYAFIMGRKSNFSQSAKIGGTLDYFAKKPEDMYTNDEKAKKRFNFTPHLKNLLTIGAVLVGTAALLFGKDKAKAANVVNNTVSTATNSAAAGAAGSKSKGALNSFNTAKNFIVKHAQDAGKFISEKYHNATTFIKGKIHKP